jgi:hypothetical protein
MKKKNSKTPKVEELEDIEDTGLFNLDEDLDD